MVENLSEALFCGVEKAGLVKVGVEKVGGEKEGEENVGLLKVTCA